MSLELGARSPSIGDGEFTIRRVGGVFEGGGAAIGQGDGVAASLLHVSAGNCSYVAAELTVAVVIGCSCGLDHGEGVVDVTAVDVAAGECGGFVFGEDLVTGADEDTLERASLLGDAAAEGVIFVATSLCSVACGVSSAS